MMEEDNPRAVELAGILSEAERELQELTGEQLDAVSDARGNTYLLSGARESLRASEQTQRTAAQILGSVMDALPAPITLIGQDGRILMVNQSWKQLATANPLQGPQFGVGDNYLAMCEGAAGADATQAHAGAAGVRAVLQGDAPAFSFEYSCHSPSGPHWFRLVATPLDKDGLGGAVVMHVDISETKRIEEQLVAKTALLEAQVDALRQSEERLRLITDMVPHAIFAKDAAGRHIFANPALAEMAGLPVEEILGKTDYELVTDMEQAEAYRADDRAVIQSGSRIFVSEEPRTDFSGRTRFLQTIKIPFKVPETGEPAVLGICIDITERKRAEEALLRQQTELQVVFDLMPAMLCVKDTENNFLRVNQRMGEAVGRPVAEIEGKSAAVVFPRDAEKYYADDLEVIRSGNAKLGIIEKIQHRDGNELLIQTDKVPLRNKEGKVSGVVVMIQDITERQRIESSLSETSALLEALLQGTSDYIYFKDLRSRYVRFSRAVMRELGLSDPHEVKGRTDFDFFTEEYARTAFDAEQEIIRTGKPVLNLEEKFTYLDGRVAWVLTSKMPWLDKAGNVVGTMGISRDITERKNLQLQFFRAQRMESVGTLAGGIAHDLNNILSPILMSIEVLKDTVSDPQAAVILNTIEISAQRGADIVRQVLSFARGAEGERIEIQLKHILLEMENIIRDTFPKDIRIQFSVPRDTWTVLGDPTQIHQILLNLCVNARDAMPNGGSLVVGVENATLDEHYAAMNLQAKPGNYVNINVTDTGTGIPAALIEKIFEPFFTTKEVGKGTGLGLSTVNAIVKGHAGFVNVYSEPGKGTTFRVYLPAMENPSQVAGDAPGETSLPRGKGETVLLVDDEASLSIIASSTMESFGYRVLTAADGAEAVAVYLEHRAEVAVVLTDMMMPVMDGPAMIHAMMRINPAVKVIATSGLNANGNLTKEAGMCVKHFLRKPYTAETLLKTLRATLEEE